MSNGRGGDGNGNGFKMGSSKTGIRHIIQNNVAWKNKAAGFYANHSSGGNTWLNNTSYNNSTQYNMLASPSGDTSQTIQLTGALAHKMRNNVGFPNKNTNMGGVDSASNSWDLNITEASAAFESTSDANCTGPREADGRLPSACTFMKLKEGSALIDKGENVGLPFVGAKPDLGAYEFAAPSGGAAASGGAVGAGGASGGSAGESAGSSGAGGLGGTGTSGGTAAAGEPGSAGGSFAGTGNSAAGVMNGTAGSAIDTAGAAGATTDDGSAAGCTCTLIPTRETGRGGLVALALLGLVVRRTRSRRALAEMARS
jgi:hypothetical protein